MAIFVKISTRHVTKWSVMSWSTISPHFTDICLNTPNVKPCEKCSEHCVMDRSSTYNKLWQIRRKGIRDVNQLLTQIPKGQNESSTIYARFIGYPIQLGVNTECSCQNFTTKWLRCKNWKVLMEDENLENKYLLSCISIFFQLVIHREWNNYYVIPFLFLLAPPRSLLSSSLGPLFFHSQALCLESQKICDLDSAGRRVVHRENILQL